MNHNIINNRIKKKLQLKNNDMKEIMKNFKNINISKNRDKLYKKNGLNSAGNLFLNDVKNVVNELIEQENYKTYNNLKLKNKTKKDILTIDTNDNIPIIFNPLIKAKIYKTEEPKRPLSNDINNNYKLISNKIIENIDNLINSIKVENPNNIKKKKNTIMDNSTFLKSRENLTIFNNINEDNFNNKNYDENYSDSNNSIN